MTDQSLPASSATRRADLEERVRALRLPAPAKGSSSNRWLWAAAIVVAGLFAWLTYVLVGHQAQNEDDEPVDPVAAASPRAAAPAAGAGASRSSENIPSASGEIALESKGHVIPAHQILVSPKVGGMIVELFIEEGRRIRKGEVLAELEKIDYEADRDRAKAGLIRAEALRDKATNRLREIERGFRELEMQQSEAELAEAQADLKRLAAEQERNLVLHAKGALSDNAFEEADAKFRGLQQRVRRLQAALDLMREGERKERREMARNEKQQAEADVLQAEADLVKSQWRLDNCTIKAPINGTILKKNAEIGNIVNPIAPQGSFSLCDMADLSDLEIELNIGERDISLVYAGQRCQVRADAYPDRTYPATVDRLMPIADRAKASIPVRVKVRVPTDEEGVYLKPEMGVKVTFYRPEAVTKDSPTKVNTANEPAASNADLPARPDKSPLLLPEKP